MNFRFPVVGAIALLCINYGECQYSSDNGAPSGKNVLNKTEVLQAIFAGYDRTVIPAKTSGVAERLPVFVGLEILSITDINDVKLTFTVQVLLFTQWSDFRLQFQHLERERGLEEHLLLPGVSHVWTPGVFFANEVTGFLHALTVANSETRIYANGTISQTERLTLTLNCQMNLRAYPLDKQECSVDLESFSWSLEDVALRWKNDKVAFTPSKFITARFQLANAHKGSCKSVSSQSSSDDFSCLSLRVQFHRQIGYYLIQVFIPCSSLVLISWVPFWLSRKSVEARLSIGITCILTLVTQTYGIHQNAPPSSYIKALDIYTAMCQFMAFAALVEIAVNYYWQKKRLDAELARAGDLESGSVVKPTSRLSAEKIDMAARIIYPAVFFFFNAIFWWIYSSG